MASASRPSLGRTPESALSGLRRKDSKHIVDTCHGTTSNGSPCRRRLSTKDAALRAMCTKKGRVLLPPGQDAAIFVCWQHEDQAEDLKAHFAATRRSDCLAHRKSLESLFENLDLKEADEEDELDVEIPRDGRNIGIHYGRSQQQFRVHNAIPDPPEDFYRPWKPSEPQRVVVETRPHDLAERPNRRELDPEKRRQRRLEREKQRKNQKPPKKERGVFASLFGCMATSGIEKEMAPRPRQRRRSSHGQRTERPEVTAAGRATLTSLQNPSTDRFAGPTAGNPHHFVRPSLDSPKSHSRRASEGQLRPDSGVAVSPRRRRQSHGSGAKSSTNLASHRQSRRKSGNLQVYRDNDVSTNSLNAPPHNRRYNSQPDARQLMHDRQPLGHRANSAPENNLNTTGQWAPQLPPTADDTARICYAKLLTAMSQPPTAMDGEGYIYMFWQTDLATTKAETAAAASIVGGTYNEEDQAHDEEILERRFFQTSANAAIPTSARRMIFLKIGMAKNVHQRIVQWQKQCGYNISLLRYYPQLQPQSQELAKVLCVRKVERLIHLHLEMLGYRVKKECRCGTEHREWFEIAGNTKAVREVDSIMRHWVAWSNEKYTAS
jgi:hypothetical protein